MIIDFWPAQLEYVEQPTIKYRGESIILNYQGNQLLGYSSVTDLDDMFSDKIISPSVKVRVNNMKNPDV